jgi:CheY-like chemotaxis protein
MISSKKTVFLADDDLDDRLLFEDALKDVSIDSTLTMAKNGQQLMEILHDKVPPAPDVIFLDLNMPRKNGLECLEEIKQTEKLRDIPIVIFSTSMQENAIMDTYKRGANFYICKPGNFFLLKGVISKVLSINWDKNGPRPSFNEFVLQPQ